MTGRCSVPAVTDSPARPDRAGIDELLKRLDETVTIHQKWNRLVDTLRAWRSWALDSGDDWAAAHYQRVLSEMGALDTAPVPGARVHITRCALRPELEGHEGEVVEPLSDGWISVRVPVDGALPGGAGGSLSWVVAVQGWEVLDG